MQAHQQGSFAPAGIGIAERGLRSLFKEYVQGSEEEMRRPRSRGGTGLGLSICSKQVCAPVRSFQHEDAPLVNCLDTLWSATCQQARSHISLRCRLTLVATCDRVCLQMHRFVAEAVTGSAPFALMFSELRLRAQVAVLGGQIGAMSKQGLGSTFWFTVPLLLPEPPRPRSSSASSCGLRRTASWSSRDAFTDGHYGTGADSGVPMWIPRAGRP